MEGGPLSSKHKKDHTAGTGVAANTHMQSAIARQETKNVWTPTVTETPVALSWHFVHWENGRIGYLPLRESDIRPPALEGNTGEGAASSHLDLEDEACRR